MISFLMSSSPLILSAAIANKASATVEAEFGDVLVPGNVLTMAHHGVHANQPAPCSHPNYPDKGIEAVGLSHFDLDTLGGCAAILGRKPEAAAFWRLVELVDVKGVHKINQAVKESQATDKDVRAFYALWFWCSNLNVKAPADGSLLEVTTRVLEGIKLLEAVLIAEDKFLLLGGDTFKANMDKLNRGSFVRIQHGVVIRVTDTFANHLYVTPDNEVGEAVVAYNSQTGSITISFAEPPKGKNAREIVQTLWGDLAGGHAGIAGSPRGQRMTNQDIEQAICAVIAAL
ncbi:MAG: hypothetical protein NTX82_02050 [Candidatus Parcubacteria bacterium]|nr:hypothetical protein [Candidatus Parcubacteria bacterium]